MEFKSLDFEVKSISEKGTFQGMAIPFGNIDLGDDRALKSISMRNAGKKGIPYLWQHDSKIPIGVIDLIGTDKGIEVKGQLFLDTNEQGIPLVPEAQKAYVMMKNNILKNSIGYKTLDYQYVKEGTKTVRDLKDIDIQEVSAVTFPMNEQANITSVKSKKEGADEMDMQKEVTELKESVNELKELLQVDTEQKRKDREYEAVRGYISNMASDDPKLASLSELILGKTKKEGKKENELDLETKEALQELYNTMNK